MSRMSTAEAFKDDTKKSTSNIPFLNIFIIVIVCGFLLVPQVRYATKIVADSAMGETSRSVRHNDNDNNDDNGDDTVTTMTTATTTSQSPLNILILYPDDWRHDDLGDANPALHTPTFTALAAEGIRFTHNAVTTSICWISRACLFTGQYVSRHKSTYLFRPTFARDDNWHTSWPHLLQQRAGYWVGHVGKWQYRDAGKYKQRIFNFSSYFEGWIVRGGKQSSAPQYIADLAGQETLRFLRERPRDRPFAATVAFYPPKGIADPDATKTQYRRIYQNNTYAEVYDRDMALRRLPSFLQDNRTDARARYRYRYETHGDYQNATVAQYATITHIDAVCGEIVAELKRQGVYDNTLVIVTADNGEFHGRHALADKWYPYQESIRVPLIVRDPRMTRRQRGTLHDAFTLNIDLAPTIVGAAGLSAPSSMQGRDVADLYVRRPEQTSDNPTTSSTALSSSSGDRPWRTEWYYEFPPIQDGIPPSIALIRRQYKYIHWWLHDREELFDLKDDPYELNDLSRRDDLKSIMTEMRQRLHTLRHDAFAPDHVPGTKCDPLLRAGTDLSQMPNCSTVFPQRCCPEMTAKQ